MGVPNEDRHDLMSWSNTTLDFEGRELGETSERVAAAAAAMAAYGAELIAEKEKGHRAMTSSLSWRQLGSRTMRASSMV